MPSIFSIGLSALSAAQAAQATTGHNLANATTAGYNRQTVLTSTNGAVNYGYGYVGMGVQITGVTRSYDELLGKQVLASKTSASYYTEFEQKISQLDNIVADSDAGFSTSLQSFFESINDLASYPNSDASRQAVLSEGDSIVAKFASLNQSLEESYSTINGQLRAGATSLNSYAEKIAQLNASIIKAQGASNGQTPNDLMDQRDQLVTELNDLVKVTTVKETNGSYSIYMGSGQPLVMGTAKATISAIASPDDPTRLQLAYQFKNNETTVIPDRAFEGGSIGAALDYRSSSLDLSRNSLGRIATVLASTFNEQHKSGQDLDGNQGKDFFTIGSPLVYPRSTNTSGAGLSVSISDASALTTSDYRVSYNGTSYAITRLSDNQITNVDPTAPTPGGFPAEVDGIKFEMPTPAMNVGDVFTVKPTAQAAATIKTALTNTREIAAALPITGAAQSVDQMNLTKTTTGSGGVTNFQIDSSSFTAGSSFAFSYDGSNINLGSGSNVTVTTRDGTTTSYPSGSFPYSDGATISTGGISFVLSGNVANGDTFTFNPVASNKGTGSISDVSVDSSYYSSAAVGETYNLTFNSATNSFTSSSALSGTIKHADGTEDPFSGTSIPYKEGDIFTTDTGISFTLKGKPAQGDKFTIAPNTDGVGDNRNAMNLAGLQTSNTIGKTTYQGSYSSFVSIIGNKANEIKVLGTAENARMTALVNQQQSISGVNRDEEAANMIQNQYAYQAAAKVIQAGSDMFDAILSIN